METNHKTIFVLDHSQYFSLSSEDFIPLDYLRGKALDITNGGGPKFSKSLWTCAVEASIEYCRIVWDLFPKDKLVRFIVSDTAAHIVNTWNLGTQNMSHVLNAMSLVGIPPRNVQLSADYSVIHGLRAAAEALAELTESQQHEKAMAKAKGESRPPNRGRVICITSARDNPSMRSLEDIFHTILIQENNAASAPNKPLRINHCDFVIINVFPMNVESLVTSRARQQLSPFLSTEVHTVSAPRISDKLTHLIMSHYDLASTTVTGIPMKEEQNANSSANYDVEILHARNAHTSICGNEALLPTSTKEGAEYETVTLKWCTPRGCGSSEMQACMAQNRVTPVDVTSRPSACLINFLLNGRSVLLEMPRKAGGKTTSHLLSARGGEIFIHSLQINRSILDDAPPLSEGPGGRLSDYRFTDYSALIRAHRFVPLKTKPKPEENLHKARERIQRRTYYFPLVTSSSIVYTLVGQINWLPFLVHKITRDSMDGNDELQCQQYLIELYSAASRGDILPFPNLPASRFKGGKKSEQYRLLCLELEALLRGHGHTSHHKVLLESVQKIRAICNDYEPRSDSDNGAEDGSVKRATTDSPLSPPHSPSCNNEGSSTKAVKRKEQRTLLEIYIAAEFGQAAKRVDFAGRLCTPPGQIANLYPNFGAKEKEVSAATNVKEENGSNAKTDLSRV